MADYAILDMVGYVTSTIVADSTFVSTYFPGAIDVSGYDPRPGIGWKYENGSFVPPPAAVPSNPLYSQKEFMDLFTQAELKLCLNYSTNTNLTSDQKEDLTVFFEYFYRTNPIDMTMLTTIGGLQMLEAFGLLPAGRAAQIYNSRH